jgi:cytochrome P450 family 110
MALTKLPPGPRTTPWVFYRYLADPFRLYEELARAYGDPFTVPTPFGLVVVTGDPVGIQQLFMVDHEDVEAHPSELFEHFLGVQSVLVLSGGRHRNRRKVIMPPFHGNRMRAYGAAMMEIALEEAARWTPGVPFSMRNSVRWITLEVILRTVFGLTDRSLIAQFRESIVELFNSAHPLPLYFPLLRHEFGGVGPWARFQRNRRGTYGLIMDQIQRKRDEGAQGEDVLSLMLNATYEDGTRMSDEEVRDDMLTLLSAGHDTTAAMLAWSFYEVCRHPEVQERLLAELAPLGPSPKADTVSALPYLEAVCNEVLRIHPAGGGVGRKLLRPLELKGYVLPRGMRVSASMVLVHKNEHIYPKPNEFRPERFLSRKLTPFEFMPFGGGIRRCVGAAFAAYEIKMVLAAIMSRFRLSLISTAPIRTVRQNLLMGPEGGVPMIFAGPRACDARSTPGALNAGG